MQVWYDIYVYVTVDITFISALWSSCTYISGLGLEKNTLERVISFSPFVLTAMVHALCGPRHLVLRPVALGENNLTLRSDEILWQSAVVDLLDCFDSCVSPRWCQSPVRSWRTIYKDGVLRFIAG